MMLRALLRCLLVALALALAVNARAEVWPSQTITIIVPYPPGGSTDTSTRALVGPLRELLGQPVVVVNRSGGTGSVGLEEGLQAKPDGYTITMTPGAILSVFPLNVARYADLNKRYVPISIGNSAPYALVVNPKKVDAKNVKEFADYLKSKRDRADYGTAGLGSTYHLFTEYLLQAIDAKAEHIPYRGDMLALQDVVSGVLDFAMLTGVIKPFVESGQLRLLGVGTAKRWPLFPDMPTFREQGFDVVAGGWIGFIAPAGTSPEIAAKLSEAFKTAYKDPRVIGVIDQLGGEVLGGGPEMLMERVTSEQKQFKALLDSGRVKLEMQ